MFSVAAEPAMWSEQSLVTASIVVSALLALVVNAALLLAVFSNRQMLDHFVLIYSAYIVNNMLCSLSYIYRRVIRLIFINNIYLSYMEKWKCHLLFDILFYAETNYCFFVFTIFTIRFLAIYCPEKFPTFTKKHALGFLGLQFSTCILICSLSYTNLDFENRIYCLIDDVPANPLIAFISGCLMFALLIISILLFTWSLYNIRLNRADGQQQIHGVQRIALLTGVFLTFRVLTFLSEGVALFILMKDQPTASRERIVSVVMLILALGKMFEPIILIIRQT
uniref:G-protein coupled receptors family 1 profile domain-containing protein n=1 Tax=Romanomermis culicivorax TaxID=13658 RepID=A0A915J0L4_ROMCU